MRISTRRPGIELDNNGREPFSDARSRRCCASLRHQERYHIPPRITWATRCRAEAEDDPSRYFLEHPGGAASLWCDRFPAAAGSVRRHRALRALGYDTGDATAAIRAFSCIPAGGIVFRLTEQSRGLLYCLYQKPAG